MAYCTVADVQAEFKSITFSASTSVTDTAVGSYIAMADEEINSRAGLKYTVPIDTTASPKAALILKRISLDLVVGRIKNILSVKTGDPKADQGGPGDSIIKGARAMLDMLVDESLVLRDAARAVVASSVASYTSNGGGSDYERSFKSDAEQW